MGIITSKSAKRQDEKSEVNKNTSDTDINQDNDIETLELKDDVKEVSALDTNVAITEAEKLRQIYKKEQEQSLEPIKLNNDFTNAKPKLFQEDETYTLQADQGQVLDSDVEDSSNAYEFKNENLKIDVKKIDQGSVNTVSGISPMRVVGLNSLKTIVTSPRPKRPIMPKSLSNEIKARELEGSFISYKVSKHYPDLLQQANDNEVGLKPLSQGKLGEKNQIRNELEKQGILTTEARAASEQVDPKQEGIISELRQMGIVQKVTADDVYTMSTGLPKRRPPPRLNHLPHQEKETETSKEVAKVSFEKRNIDDILKGYANEKNETEQDDSKPSDPGSTEKKETPGNDSEYFCTIGIENVGDAEKLKLKLFDVEML